jgi:hypothetical protein
MTDELKIEFGLKYPLYLKRRSLDYIVAVDSAGTVVARFINYNHAYELVRLVNGAYKLFSDLSLKPYENPAKPAHDPRRPEIESGLPDPAKADGS